MRCVISLGGSIITSNLVNLKEYARIIRELKESCEKIVVVTGAGKLKEYIKASCKSASQAEKDYIGIHATRLNALVLRSYISKACPKIPENFKDAQFYLKMYDIVIMGGTEPGHSTDAVSAIISEIIDADLFINATDVDGVYDKDPKKFRDAKLLKKVSYRELEELVGTRFEAGSYPLLDWLAIQVLKRSRIKTVIINGKDPENLHKAIKGKIGTEVLEL